MENTPPDMNNEIIKPIIELLQMNFFIPSYQRGYRWTKRQVDDLLDDISKFNPQNNDEWYCLQPLVVKEKNKENNEWEVIDGQQRLTTIFLIIHYINQRWVGADSKEREPIIKYQTRDDNDHDSYQFLKDIKVEDNKDVKINDENIDYHYISSAYKAINDWANKNKDIINKNDFQSYFKHRAKVIWYETGAKDGRDIFSRINRGKIPLTNAELIKALFLNSSNFKTKNAAENSIDEDQINLKKLKEEQIRLKQLQIATEWDIMETELNNNEFWLFINKEKNNLETRIEYLFELIVGKSDGADNEYFTFRKFSEDFKGNTVKTIEDKWKEIKRCFQTLKYWFEDRELYHKIGFLITLDEDIKNLTEQSLERDKLSFKSFIDSEIKNKFTKIKIDELVYGDGNIKKILLLHNILTMLKYDKDNSRFPFNRYKNQEWEIEHIHAVATEMPELEQDQKDWLDYVKDYISETETDLIGRMDNYSKEKFEPLYKEILEYLKKEGKHEDINDLSNLALLDDKTNRGYQNAFFRFKRETIIEKEKKGVFIPICTRNVFMKYYSHEIDQMILWGEEDRKCYLDNIKEVLREYLPQENNQ